MSDELFFDGLKYISAADAADHFGLNRDYVARLARIGKLAAKRVGKSWYVSEHSISEFVVRQKYENAKRARELAFDRKREYRKAVRHVPANAPVATESPISRTPEPTTFSATKLQHASKKFDARAAFARAIARNDASVNVVHAAPLYAAHPMMDFIHRATALITALVLVFGSYAFADPETARPIITEARTTMMAGGMALLRAPETIVIAARSFSQVDPRTILPDSNASLAAAAFGDSGSLQDVARRFNRAIDAFVFDTMFERAFVLAPTDRGSVVVTVGPAVVANITAIPARSSNPVSPVSGSRAISVAGVTKAYVDQGLASLQADFLDRLAAMENANSTSFRSLSRSGGSSINTSNVTITGGTITGVTISGGSVTATAFSGILPIASGGTATSATPIYGQLLVGDGNGGYALVATSSLGIGAGSGAPGGANGTVQFNNGGLFSGDAEFAYNTSANLLAVAFASSSAISALDGLFVGRTATTSIFGSATSTFGAGIRTTALDVTGATSTFANGINLATGCFAIGGVCIGAGGGGMWGSITGTLANQTDLQAALDAKLSLTAWYATTTDALDEGSNNFYFTLSRFAGALAGTTTDALAQGSTNRYYSNTLVQNYLDTVGKEYFFATTSADYWQSQRNFFSTSSADYYASVTNFFSTSSANYFVASSSTIPKTYTANTFTQLQTFANASTSILSANTFCLSSDCRSAWPSSGLLAYDAWTHPSAGVSATSSGLIVTASSTIGNGTSGLTISGSATTTGNAYFASTVGIGTNAAYPLDVNGRGRFVGTDGAVGAIGGNDYVLSLQNNGASSWLEILNQGGAGQGVFFGVSDNRTANAFELWNYQAGPIDFFTSTTPSDGVNRLRIAANGNVGIGTTDPQAILDVRDQLFVRNADGAVGSNDGVEIATDSSAPRVSLVQGGRYVGLFQADAPGNTYLKNVAGGALILTGGSGGNVELARLTNDGYFGIGTTSPYAMLSVAGDVVGARFVATTSVASVFPFASTTALSATALCLGGDCRTVWPATGSTFGYLFPNNATSTALEFSGGIDMNNSTISRVDTLSFYNGATQLQNITNQYNQQGLRIKDGSNYSNLFAQYRDDGSTAAQSGDILLATSTNVGISYYAAATSSLGLPTFADLTGFSNFAYLFPNGATTSLLSFTNGLLVGASSTIANLSTINSTSTNATTTNLYVSGTITGAGLAACNDADDKLVYNALTSRFECASDAGAGGGITSLGAAGQGQTGSSQIFATSSDANIGLTITSAGDTHTFTSTWTGTLAVGRGGTGLSSSPSFGELLVGNGTGYTLTATSSLGLPTFSDLSNYALSSSLFAYPFPNNATSTTLAFTGGILSTASSTIGNGTQTGGLTVSGGATTTGNQYIGGSLSVNGSSANRFNGTGDVYIGNASFYSALGGFPDLGVEGYINSNTAVITAQGTAAAPSFQFGGTNNTGFYATGLGGSAGIGFSVQGSQLATLSNTTFNLSAGLSALTGTFSNSQSGHATILTLANTISAAADRGPSMVFNGVGSNEMGRIDSAWNGAANTDAYLSFSTRGAGTVVEALRIASTGNVGIGTTSPYAKLSVAGDIVGARFVATTTATSTFAGGIQTAALNVTSSTATSTFANGIQLSAGCFRMPDGSCAGTGSGTVTSVNASGGTTGLSFSGGPVTTSGTLSLGGTLVAANGGTGTSTPAAWGHLLAWTGSNYQGTATSSLGLPTFTDLNNYALASSLFAYPFSNNATSTTLAFNGGLLSTASSTFTNTVRLPSLASGTLNVGADGLIYSAASTTYGVGLSYSNGTVTNAGVTVIQVNGPLQKDNPTGNVTLSITQSNASTDGYLSSTDWNAFNNKVSSSSLDSFFTNGRDWQIVAGALAPTTTRGVLITASSTIGNGTQTGGLTISGGATTTGNATIEGRLDVWDAGRFYNHLSLRNGTDFFVYSSNNTNYGLIESPGTGDLSLGTDAAPGALYIANNGNVGIGTTSPYAKFSVLGNAAIAGNLGVANLTATGTVAFTGLTSGFVGNNNGTLYSFATSTLGFLSSYDAWTHPSAGVSATTSGLLVTASSTIGSGTQQGGLTISGGATTTGNSIVSGNQTVGGTLQVTGETTLASSLTGVLKAAAGVVSAGLVDLASEVSGILGVSNGGTGWGNIQANSIVLGNGSGSLATTTAGTNGQVLALVNGVPTWQSTTTLSTISGTLAVNQGGTGLTSTPTYGQILVGNGTGYTLTATSSLGLLGANERDWRVTAGALAPTTTLGILVSASSTIGNGTQTGGLTISGGATTTGNAYFGGNVGIGTSSPSNAALSGNILAIQGTNGSLNDGIFVTSSGNSLIGLAANTSSKYPALNFYDSGTSQSAAVGSLLLDRTSASFTGSQRNNLVLGTLSGAGTNVQLATEGTARLTVTNTGNVGIGTTSPYAKLSVLGNAAIAGNLGVANLTATGTIAFTGLTSGFVGNNNGTLYSFATSTLGFISSYDPFTHPSAGVSATTSGLIVTASSTIGNGTQTGGLTISGGATTTGALAVTGTNASSTFAGNVQVDGALKVGTGSIYLNGSATSTFSAGVQTSALNVTSSSATSTFANGIQLSGGCFRDASGSCITNADLSSYVTVSGGSANRVAFFSGSGTNISSSANLLFDGTTLTANDLLVSKSGTAILSINDTSSSGTDFRLDVASGGATFNADIGAALSGEYFVFATNNDEKVRITENGRVGIGTDNPQADLHVLNSGLAKITLESTGADQARFDLLSAGRDTWLFGNSISQASAFEIYNDTDGASRFLIDDSGNVGIGTTTPATKLSVQGNGLFSGNLAAASLTATGTITFSGLSSGFVGSNAGKLYSFATSTLGFLSSYDPFTHPSAGVSATTSGLIVTASSTIGNGTQTGGLTISGGATTTGSAYITGGLGVGVANTNTGTIRSSSTITSGGALLIASNDAGALGASGTAWSDLFLASGGVINWNASNVTLTQGSNTLTLAGVTSGFTVNGGNSFLNTQANTTGARNFGPKVWTDNLFGMELGHNGSIWTTRIVTRDSDGGIEFGKYPTGSTTNVESFSPWMTIINSGNVGIGTTSPGTRLEVEDANGNGMRLAAPDGDPGFFIQKRDNGASQYWGMVHTGTRLAFGPSTGGAGLTGFSEKVSFLQSGNVGIGTTTPSVKLTVGAGGGNALDSNELFQFANNGTVSYGTIRTTGNKLYLGAVDGSGSGTGSFIGSQTSTNFSLRTAGTDKLTIDTSGNVGIGTTTPGSLLSLGNTGANTINISATATSTFGSGINIRTGCFAINGTCLSAGGGSGTVGSGTTGQFPYYAANGTTLTATSSLYIATSGNVGIGTVNPGMKLDVVGNNATIRIGSDNSNEDSLALLFDHTTTVGNQDKTAIFSSYRDDLGWGRSDLIFALDSAADTGNVASSSDAKLIIKNSGDVGIGTASPGTKLDVRGALSLGDNAPFGADSTYYADNNYIMFGHSGASEDFIGYKSNTFYFADASGGGDTTAPNVVVLGNLGVGQTSPSAKVHITDGNLVLTRTSESQAVPEILLHFDGADTSTTITNNGSGGATFSAFGNAQIDTAQSQFGGASVLFDNNNDALTMQTGTFSYASNFSIDTWIRPNTLANTDRIFSEDTNSYSWTVNSSGNLVFSAFNISLTCNAAITTGSWQHIAVVRNGSTATMYVNGTSCATDASSDGTLTFNASVTYIGNNGGLSQDYDGWIDEFRMVGTPLWSSNFTPPAAAFSGTGSDSGYIGLGVTSPTSPIQHLSGARLTEGGSWTNASDRNLKTNFTALDSEQILSGINALEITKWNYKVESASTTHIGPVAQDFFAQFGLGDSDTSISTIDSAGVALMGVQALSKRLDAVAGGLGVDLGLLASSTATSTGTTPSGFFAQYASLNATTTNTGTLCLGGECRSSWSLLASAPSGDYVSASTLASYTSLTTLGQATSTLATSFNASLDAATSSIVSLLRAEIGAATSSLNLAQFAKLSDLWLPGADTGEIALLSATTSVAELTDTATTSTATSTPWIGSFADASQGLKDGFTSIADTVVQVFTKAFYATVGIFEKVFAKEVHTDMLCVSDETGETCITKAQLDALIQGQAAAAAGSQGSGDAPEDTDAGEGDSVPEGDAGGVEGGENAGGEGAAEDVPPTDEGVTDPESAPEPTPEPETTPEPEAGPVASE